MANGGYWGKMIEIDMTAGTVEVNDKHMQYVDEWVGGRPLGMKMLWEELKDKPGIDPMGPENIAMLIPGPVGGTPLISASRYEAISKSCITQLMDPSVSPYGEFSATVANAAGGGWFGPALKHAGYDMILVRGMGTTPKYLYINNETVELRDAGDFWGMKTPEFEQAVQEQFGSMFKTVSIGPAAENGVRYSCTMSETGRAAGRGGTGCVLGTKKFKGVVVYGDQAVPVADPAGLNAYIEKVDQMSWAHSGTPGRRRWGTAASLDGNSDSGRKSVRNHREGTDPYRDAISCVASQTGFWVRHRGCWSCQQRCMKIGVVRQGPWAGLIAEGPEYESAMNSSNWLINNMEDFGAVMNCLDANGFDLIGIGGIVGFTLEAYEKGLITAADLGGIQAEWGNGAEIVKLMEAIIHDHTNPIFDYLRRGSQYTAKYLGNDSIKFAMECKNHSFAAHGCQHGSAGRGLGYGTSNRGACHVSGNSAASQNSTVVRDMGVFCSFSSGCLGTAGMGEMINFVCGFTFTTDQYIALGEKCYNLEKAFNVLNGFRRVDDLLPDRVHDEPLLWGPWAGSVFSREEYMTQLDDYYTERGWDVETTIPSAGRLQELGLNDVVPYLQGLS